MSQLDHWSAVDQAETRDVFEREGMIGWWSYVIFVVVVLALGLLAYWLIAPRPFAGPLHDHDRQLPDVTVLQDNLTAHDDLVQLRQTSDRTLSSSGPSEFHPGTARMPIDQAIAEIARRGMPIHAFKAGSYRLIPSAAEANR